VNSYRTWCGIENPEFAARPVEALSKVTAVLYAFNEERFIGEAVRSMLDQDYANMEFVLSDDGSTDRTFEIMEQLVRDYTGPHRVILNRNSTNLGIGSQINAAVAKTTGSFIVLVNGDDVSHPDRVRKLVEQWAPTGQPKAAAVGSSLRQIAESGVDLNRLMDARLPLPNLESAVRSRFGGPLAACLGFDRAVFDSFGPLPDNLILEDSVLLCRAVLLGPVRYVDEPLVDYRLHGNNISQTYALQPYNDWQKRQRSRVLWHKSEGVKAYLEILRDMHQRPAAEWEPTDLARARWAGMEKLLENSLLRDYYAGVTPVGDLEKLGSLFRLVGLVIKTRLKRWFPAIERRNDRWHYGRVVEAVRKRP
jgi:glycosyltransferase involved in cell wall biosynthesis